MHRSHLGLVGVATLGLVALSLLGSRLAGADSPRDSRYAPAPAPVPGDSHRVATFAGGCFWSMQKAFDGVPGVSKTTAGFAGGSSAKPSYEQVSEGETGHAESVQLVYDPDKISYERLLDIYWHHIDPLTLNRAFCDHGAQYRSIIFYHDAEQQRLAEASKRALDQSHRFSSPIVTAVQPATPFYPAEEYHQQFYKKYPARYEAYRIGCGRDQRIRELWGDEVVSKGAEK
ncbi:MAG: peptide-methionine (S)-S-oxide reductase MsrA [Gemmatimonadales bacterium]